MPSLGVSYQFTSMILSTIDASQPHLKQEKCASRREGAIFAMESKDIEETDRPWTWMVVDGERFSFDEVKRMYARYQKE